jgi:serine/threonine protein kinase
MEIRELEILLQLSQIKDNFYTIKLIEAFTTDEAQQDASKFSDLFLVTDYYENDMFTILKDNSYLLQSEQAVHLIYNLLVSLKFMESLGLMHRDIKP